MQTTSENTSLTEWSPRMGAIGRTMALERARAAKKSKQLARKQASERHLDSYTAEDYERDQRTYRIATYGCPRSQGFYRCDCCTGSDPVPHYYRVRLRRRFIDHSDKKKPIKYHERTVCLDTWIDIYETTTAEIRRHIFGSRHEQSMVPIIDAAKQEAVRIKWHMYVGILIKLSKLTGDPIGLFDDGSPGHHDPTREDSPGLATIAPTYEVANDMLKRWEYLRFG